MEKLSQYLSSTGQTQAEFAKRLGTTQANVSKLCGASPPISLDMALRIEVATSGVIPVEAWPKFEGLAHRRAGAAQ